MNIRYSQKEDIPRLRELWKQAFGDSDTFLDHFFSILYTPRRCLCGWEDGKPVAVVYWIDYKWHDHTIAYAYAVAVDQECRGRGYCQELLKALKPRLKKRGYFGILLVPENQDLAEFYQFLGYTPVMGAEHFTVPAAGDPDPGLRQIPWQQYRQYRTQLLPEESLLPDEDVYRFLATYLKFYIADAGLFCGWTEQTEEGKVLHMEEFLGECRSIFQVIRAMDCVKGHFRLKGHYAYGMMMWLTEDHSAPKYHGFPMA